MTDKCGVIWALVFILFAGGLSAQDLGGGTAKTKHWIFLKDKGPETTWSPRQLLSEKAINRRKAQGIEIDSRDYPVNAEYVSRIAEKGIPPLRKSKWLNAVSAMLDAKDVQELLQLDFVVSIQPMMTYKLDLGWKDIATKQTDLYDSLMSFPQLQQLGLDKLHTHGFNGRGVTVAVFDTEFANVDSNAAFSHLMETGRILATYDFVNNEEDVYALDQGSAHGAWVLSILAGHIRENFMGSAPGASFILAHTENTSSETHQEEDNWVAAAEWADSLGADMFTTSLGYSTFDKLPIFGEHVKAIPGDDAPFGYLHTPAPLSVDYDYGDMDGNTTIIARAADIAASKGIVVLNSAGNEGNSSWHYITSPADGDSVIAVGAIKEDHDIASFSSRGPSSDGQVKPDFVAMGQGNAFVTVDGGITFGSGTSFSCPTLAGLVACILQANPGMQYQEVHDLLRNSADRKDNPDDDYGYGLPNGPAILEALGYTHFTDAISDFDLSNRVIVYPVPASEEFTVIVQNNDDPFNAAIKGYDLQGRKVLELEARVEKFNHRISINRDQFFGAFPEGRIILQVFNMDTEEVIDSRNVYLLKD